MKESLVRCISEAYTTLSAPKCGRTDRYPAAWKFNLELPEEKIKRIVTIMADADERKKRQLFVYGLPTAPPWDKSQSGYVKEDGSGAKLIIDDEFNEWDHDEESDEEGKPAGFTQREGLVADDLNQLEELDAAEPQ